MKQQRLFIICHVWPEPASSAAGTRMLELAGLFAKAGFGVTMGCDAHRTEHSVELSPYGINTVSIILNDASFDRQLRELEPDIVLFDRFMTEEKYGWRVSEQCPDAMKILDTEDLHCLRKARQLALKTGQPPDELLLASDASKREIASIYRCDLSLIISDYEMNLLQSLFRVDAALLQYLPFLPPALSEEESASWPSFHERQHFVSIGNFIHEPNADAVSYLKEKIWPLIRRQLPEAELHAYGAYPSQKFKALDEPSKGFFIKGRAPSSKEVIQQGRLLLAPLRFGAGLKGKLLEAMLYGTPSVTTGIGAEGMHGSSSWNGVIADSPEGFAAAAVSLYRSETAWKEAQANGAAILRQWFPSEKHRHSLLATIASIRSDLKTHRSRNFTGAMLQHHSMASTRHLSKWIELKNKL